MKQSYVFLADGFEEMEAIGTVDILRRAGMKVLTVSVKDAKEVTGAHDVPVIADALLRDVVIDNAGWLVFPGGMPGAQNLYECEALQELLKSHVEKGGKVAAICASPAVVLGQLGYLDGTNATCYPGFEKLCVGAKLLDERSVTDGNVITANGPSSVTNFAYAIVVADKGKEVADKVMTDMLLYPKQQSYFF